MARPKKYDNDNARRTLHNILNRIINLCYTQTYNGWEKVGGIGIGIDQEWFDFKTFYDWAISTGYKYGKTLERIDKNENFTPSNCKWVDSKHRRRVRKVFRKLTFNNQTKPLPVWAVLYGMSPQALTRRINSGWEVEDALTTPLRAYKGRMLDDENSMWE